MKKCKLLNEKQISELNKNQLYELTNEHNQLYTQYVDANQNLEHVEFDANRYWNDTITEEQAEWLDAWLEKAEQLDNFRMVFINKTKVDIATGMTATVVVNKNEIN